MTNLIHNCFILQYAYYDPLHVSSIICSSSGGWIVLMQHLVSSPSVSGCPVHRLRGNICHSVWVASGLLVGVKLQPPDHTPPIQSDKYSLSTCAPDSHLLSVTIPDAASIQFNILMMSILYSNHQTRRHPYRLTNILSQPVHRTATYWEWRYQMLHQYNSTSWWWTYNARNM